MRVLALVLLVGCAGPLRTADVLVLTTEPLSNPNPAWRVHQGELDASVADEVARLVEEARRLSVAFENEEALGVLGRAQTALEERGALTEDFDALHVVWALRALIESNMGRDDRVEEALREAARLRPDATLDPVLFPPDLIARFAALATEVRAEPPASVAVTTSPSDSRVRLDGVDMGSSPATARGTPGRHHLRVDALGHEARVLPIELRSEGNEPISVALPRASEEVLFGQLLSLDPERLVALSPEALEADVLVRVRDDRTVALELSTGRTFSEATQQDSVRRALDAFAPSRTGLRVGVALATLLVVGAAITTALLLTRETDTVFRIDTAE